MKIHFLGTGAADWDIKNPNTTQNFRRFSSILVDDCLLVDPGPCIREFMDSFGCPALLDSCKYVINTHRHGDHYNQEMLASLPEGIFHPMAAGETWETDDHIISAYAAHHGTVKDGVHFVIESKADGKRFFYGCDGAWMYYETAWALLKQKFDLMIFDCTIGDLSGDYRIFEHNNVAMVAEMKATFQSRGCCENYMVSHMARTLHPTTHADAAAVLAGYGIDTAWDNRVVIL